MKASIRHVKRRKRTQQLNNNEAVTYKLTIQECAFLSEMIRNHHRDETKSYVLKCKDESGFIDRFRINGYITMENSEHLRIRNEKSEIKEYRITFQGYQACIESCSQCYSNLITLCASEFSLVLSFIVLLNQISNGSLTAVAILSIIVFGTLVVHFTRQLSVPPLPIELQY